jgi:hypothetical protein
MPRTLTASQNRRAVANLRRQAALITVRLAQLARLAARNTRELASALFIIATVLGGTRAAADDASPFASPWPPNPAALRIADCEPSAARQPRAQAGQLQIAFAPPALEPLEVGFPKNEWMLAQLPSPTMGQLGTFLLCAFCVMGIAAAVLVFINQYREAFGRKPPVDDAIEALRKQLEGLAPSAKVEKLIEQIGGAATREELAKVVALLMEKEKDLSQQIKDVRAYSHEGMHGVRHEMQAALLGAVKRDEDLGEKLDQHTRDMSRDRSVSVARLHERIEAMCNTLRAEFEQKLQIVHKDIGDLPGKLLTLLQQTGHLGRGGKP